MRQFVLTFFTLISCYCISAQTSAPNFNTKDIENNTHNLYQDYLEKGKPVVMDVSATWCSRCWSFHSKHILRDVYNEVGPEGLDIAMVLFVEGDSNTPKSALYGGSGSRGDWTKDTPYPIIDSLGKSIADAYNVAGFPVVNLISPNKTYVRATNLTLTSILDNVYNMLPVPSLDEDAAIHKVKADAKTCSAVEVSFDLFNKGKNTIASAKFDVLRNGQFFKSYDWTGSIATYKSETITFKDLLIDPAINKNEFTVMYKGSVSNDNVASRSFSVATAQTVETSRFINIDIAVDQNAQQDKISFDVVDDMGTIVFESGLLTGGQNYNVDISLSKEGCHKLVLRNQNGNGNAGRVKITDSKGVVVYDANPGSSFETFPINFAVERIVNTNNHALANHLTLSPNVVRDVCYLELAVKVQEHYKIELVNTNGKVISTLYNGQLALGNQRLALDVSEVAFGQYFLSVETTTAKVALPLIKQ